ncbi:glycosyltransferase family 39 protein [Candidatus Daviesbacteria bacterium]|nr:glycosyltransferase family 39 protein [Candidatus Daviesbacteria bacterium]
MFKVILNVFKKIPSWVFIILIFLSLGFVLYNSRQIFFFKYESEYYENLYYHSQWNITGSTRGMSDGMLYKFVGYRLVQGENPFYLNYEAPPFGKYLYGLAEYFFGNPYLVSLGLYLLSVIVFWFLTRELFQKKKYSLAVLLVFTTTPFIATQVRDTMLDLPLTAFFLIHIFFFMKFLNKPRIFFLGLSGVFLGLATGTKIGVYTPGAILLGLPLVIWAGKKLGKLPQLINPLFYLGSIFAGYCIAFISYFIHHPNPIPWLKLHQKQLDFYLKPEGNVDYLNQWRGIFANTYQGWWGAGQTGLGDWSPILPLGTVAAASVFILALKRKEKPWIYIAGITLVFLIMNTFISFWPRYLMPAIPGFILLIAYFGRKFAPVLLVLAFLNLPYLHSSMAVKNYESSAGAPANFISQRAYRELYRSIDPNQRNSISEDQFIKDLESFYETLTVRKIDTQVKNISNTEKGADVVYDIKYLTDYGEVSFSPKVEFIDIHNQVYINWKWDYLWPGYSNKKKIISESRKPTGTDGREIRNRVSAVKVYIITRHVKWPETLNQLAEVVEIPGGVEVGERVNWVIPDDFPRYIGLLNKNLGEEGRKKAADIKGVKLREIDFDVSADIYFENNGEREYILKSAPVNFAKF